ncbi:MAG: tetratricopeptide repeat protein [Myxococcota bacterium]
MSPAVMAGAVERERVRLDSLERSEADFKLGVAAQRRGHLDAAAEAYAKAVERDPSFVEAMVNLARVRAAEGRFDQADEWLDRASLVRDDYPDIAAARGLVALGRGDAKLAVSELTRARVVEPDDVEVLINLGAALIEAGLWLEAIGHLDRAARLDTTRSAAVLNLALAHDHRGDAARAAFHYRRYLDLVSPGDPEREAVEARLERLAGRVPHAVKAKAPPEEASEGNTPPDINPTRTAGR